MGGVVSRCVARLVCELVCSVAQVIAAPRQETPRLEPHRASVERIVPRVERAQQEVALGHVEASVAQVAQGRPHDGEVRLVRLRLGVRVRVRVGGRVGGRVRVRVGG